MLTYQLTLDEHTAAMAAALDCQITLKIVLPGLERQCRAAQITAALHHRSVARMREEGYPDPADASYSQEAAAHYADQARWMLDTCLRVRQSVRRIDDLNAMLIKGGLLRG